MGRALDCGLSAWVVVLAAIVEAEADAAVDGRRGTDALSSTRDLAARGFRIVDGSASLHPTYVRDVLDGLADRGFVERTDHSEGDRPVFLWKLTRRGRAHLQGVVDDVLSPICRLSPPTTAATTKRRRPRR